MIDRKNWLFANTQTGAEASATAYSIIETAKANGLNLFLYLTCLLRSLPNFDASDAFTLDEYLPWSESITDKLRKEQELLGIH